MVYVLFLLTLAGFLWVSKQLRSIMSTFEEASAQLDRVIASQTKTVGEIQQLQGTVTTLNSTIADLQAQIASGSVTVPPAFQTKLDQAEALAKQADDEIPDVPTDPGTGGEEVPVEP